MKIGSVIYFLQRNLNTMKQLDVVLPVTCRIPLGRREHYDRKRLSDFGVPAVALARKCTRLKITWTPNYQ